MIMMYTLWEIYGNYKVWAGEFLSISKMKKYIDERPGKAFKYTKTLYP